MLFLLLALLGVCNGIALFLRFLRLHGALPELVGVGHGKHCRVVAVVCAGCWVDLPFSLSPQPNETI